MRNIVWIYVAPFTGLKDALHTTLSTTDKQTTTAGTGNNRASIGWLRDWKAFSTIVLATIHIINQLTNTGARCFWSFSFTDLHSPAGPVWPGIQCCRSTGRFLACWHTDHSCTSCHSAGTRWHLTGDTNRRDSSIIHSAVYCTSG